MNNYGVFSLCIIVVLFVQVYLFYFMFIYFKAAIGGRLYLTPKITKTNNKSYLGKNMLHNIYKHYIILFICV